MQTDRMASELQRTRRPGHFVEIEIPWAYVRRPADALMKFFRFTLTSFCQGLQP